MKAWIEQAAVDGLLKRAERRWIIRLVVSVALAILATNFMWSRYVKELNEVLFNCRELLH